RAGTRGASKSNRCSGYSTIDSSGCCPAMDGPYTSMRSGCTPSSSVACRGCAGGPSVCSVCRSMKRYIELFKETWKEFSDDKAQRLGASLAYYTLFSIAPLLLICIAIAGLVFGKSQAQAQIIGQIKNLMGDAGGGAITDMLKNAAKPKTGTLAIIIGGITLLLGAAGVFGNLKDALNTIWNVPEKKSGGIMAMLKQRFLSFAMVLGVGFLLLVSLVIDAALSAISGGLWQPIQLAVSFVVVTLLFAMIFR